MVVAHIHELIDFTVGVVIVNKQKVLLIFHKKLQLWLFPGGHIELDEDPNQAAIREVKEETGLDVILIGGEVHREINTKTATSLVPPLSMEIHNFNETHRHVNMVYAARVETDQVALQTEEAEDIRWFSKEELDDEKYQLIPGVKFHAKEMLEKLND